MASSISPKKMVPKKQVSMARSLGIVRTRSTTSGKPSSKLLTIPDNSSKEEFLLKEQEEKAKKSKFCNLKGDLIALKSEILGSWLNLLLILVPFGFISYYANWDQSIIFFINFFAMIPLASILGDATECLAEHLGETVGGLLNASFGNAVEIVVMILALAKAETYRDSPTDTDKKLILVVQTSLIGSIFSNSLLVLGCVFVANGIKYKESSFNVTSVSASVSLLMIASFVMILPAPYAESNENHDELMVSRAAAIILMIMYLCSLVFVLYTHRDINQPNNQENEDSIQHLEMHSPSKNQGIEKSADIATHDEIDSVNNDDRNNEENKQNNEDRNLVKKEDHQEEEEEEEGDELDMSLLGSMLLLLGSTILVAVLSEYLVDAIEPMSESIGMSEAFVGIILLPIIGNAVEHITAVRLAYRNKMDIALSIAIGSAAQVAMFVVPLAVIVAWCMDLDLALDFETFEVNMFIYSTIIIFALVIDGSSNWLEGVMLLSMYTLIAIAVWDQEFEYS